MLLILTLCHVLSGQCKTEPLDVPDAPKTPMACLMQAQPTVAEYAQHDPNYRVERVRCMTYADYNRLEHRG